jgi:hypothetical protein
MTMIDDEALAAFDAREAKTELRAQATAIAVVVIGAISFVCAVIVAVLAITGVIS